MTHLKVAVRVRPMSQREQDLKATSIVHVENDKTISITNLRVRDTHWQHGGCDSRHRVRRFKFDRCFAQNATQQDLFATVAEEISSAIENRYNSCVLAYGQSASGKTHTMIGLDKDAGIIPRLCQSIFRYLQQSDVQNSEHRFEEINEIYKTNKIMDDLKDIEAGPALATVSYLEIYNEKVRDLLTSHGGVLSLPLKVREHPRKGPYVQGLSEKGANNPETLLYWLRVGNANRQVAANGCNPHSSRSHSVFTITCCQGQSKVHLVDLAGSERPGTKSCSTTVFREGANINRSLVALGNVISTLAERSAKYSKYLRKRFVPFRDSILTWILKDTLSGNSKTIMIATVSPASTCYNETVNTLRFGQRAKQIAVQPICNEDPKERVIRNLRLEIEALKQLLLQANLQVDRDTELRLPFISCSSEASIITSPIFVSSTDSLNSSTLSDFSVKSEEDSNNNNVIQQTFATSEELIPVMNVATSVSKPDKAKLRRTFSVVDGNNKEKIAFSKEQFKSQEVLDKSSASSSRKHSLDKLRKTIALAKSPPLLRAVAVESKAVGTEVRNPNPNPKVDIKSRVNSIRKATTPKPRSQIIASVTQRLYNKVKKKEIGTGTEDLLVEPKPPEELNICSNARLRLRELTQKALRAHKWKTVDTQTDLFPVLRVKETSTDVDDLQIALLEVKHAEISTDFIATNDTGVDCCMLQQFAETEHPKHLTSAFLVTRSCGTQSPANPEVKPTNAISFKKYLQDYQEPAVTVANASLIYANSVNLNTSQQFSVRQYSDTSSQCSSTARKTSDTHSPDSLDEDFQCLNPTPDLISNHNSMEQQNQVVKVETIEPVKFASTTLLQQELFMNQDDDFALDDDICTANFLVTPKCQERLDSVTRPSCHSAETCSYQEEERCQSFQECYRKHTPVFVEENQRKLDECVRLIEPLVLKSIMKNYDDCLSDDSLTHSAYLVEREGKFKDLPDSLEYHQVNMKRVRFTPEEHTCNNTKMVEAMAGFLKEATSLMSTLSLVAKDQQQKVTEHSTQPKATKKHRSRSSSHNHCCMRIYNETTGTQTSPKHAERYSLPVNQYDLLVNDSCDRLVRCIDRLESNTPRQLTPEELLHRFPQPFSAMPAPHSSPGGECTSLDSNYTFSDYGSLPRRSSRRSMRMSCSPSGYLRQLTSMRKKIVDGSREQMQNGGCSSRGSGSIRI